uniref:LIM and calponin homology domains 1 n=1 Tax=Fundulus heteroclitus TaxID=8078 RepID=A0A3Q2R1L1_FUNHE
MASPVADLGQSHQHHLVTESAADAAFLEAQKWIEAATGRCFGDKDFRGGLENGILLCELLSSIRPGLVKKINRLPTPIAGLDNLSVFLRGCEELGLKGSQLFDPGDLQDTSTRPAAKGSDCSRRLKNVLITIYWLGRAANSCTSYNGPTLDLKEFEGLLSQMRKEAEAAESPQRSIRDSGYIDCWDSERSDSLSPPRHGREDSFDSLDSFGSRSQQTPSPDVLVPRGSSDGRGSDSESDGTPNRKMPDLHKDDMLARRTSVTELRTAMPFNQYLPNRSNQSGYVPAPLRKKKCEKEEGGRKSCSTATSPVGVDRPCRSVSMNDMCGEEEAIRRPHSHVRHELMHNQYNRMKEDENHWQEDLARWKSRRRSVSQDLIKKEEERKMMERLMSGDSCISQRRKSIKTYREIVEEKERREEELREAYRKARTPEEASAILQRYAQRFSISEAILERLQLPKLLDRSVSADPSLSTSPFSLSLSSSPTTPDPFDEDPSGPMRYLRQQSAPTPRFTSTLEAQIAEFPKDSTSHQRPQIRSRSSEPPSTRALSPKPVPLLTPKPYFQPRLSADEKWNGKGDSLLRVNGDIGIDAASMKPEWKERESPPQFQPSPSESGNGTAAASTPDASPARSPPASPETGSQASTQANDRQGSREVASQDAKVTESSPPPTRPTSLPEELNQPEDSFSGTGGLTDAAQQEEKSNAAAKQAPPAEPKPEKTQQSSENLQFFPTEVNTLKNQAFASTESFQRTEAAPTSAAPGSLGYLPPKEASSEDAEKDPHGNEKYQREQEKLKEEWEKAQREVAEEERKYHEEERKILEETVMPLTPRSSALPSPSREGLSSTSEPQDTIVRSLADWERKQELLERRSRGSTESADWKRRENDRTSDISTADDSMKTARSMVSQNSSQAEKLSQSVHNSQKPPPTLAKCSTPDKRQPGPSADSTRASRPAGERRSVSGRKLCSSCGQPLGKGAAMIIETLSLYFHIHCFKCGVCKGQLGDTTTGTDVRIRNGLLNCNQCYIRSRSAGQPTTL